MPGAKTVTTELAVACGIIGRNPLTIGASEADTLFGETVSHCIQMDREYDHKSTDRNDVPRFKTFAVDSFDELWHEL